MSRTIPTALLTALGQPNVAPFYAVEFSFDTAPVRFWTGYGDRTIEGNTYIGAGSLIGIGGLEEVADLSAKSATITLSGVPVELVSLALQEPYQNRACRILFGADTLGVSDPNWVLANGTWSDSGVWVDSDVWRDSSLVVVAYSTVEVFGGFMDVMTIEDSGETSTISLTVESKLVQLERAKELRYTNESQRALFPSDTFFSFVADLQDKEVVWGRKSA
jgi:hypothetical protein